MSIHDVCLMRRNKGPNYKLTTVEYISLRFPKGSRFKGCISENCAESFGIQEAESFRIADANRGDGKRVIVHADEKLVRLLNSNLRFRACGELV